MKSRLKTSCLSVQHSLWIGTKLSRLGRAYACQVQVCWLNTGLSNGQPAWPACREQDSSLQRRKNFPCNYSGTLPCRKIFVQVRAGSLNRCVGGLTQNTVSACCPTTPCRKMARLNAAVASTESGANRKMLFFNSKMRRF